MLEILSGPLTVWVAPVGTAFPVINAAPAGTWFKLGTNGPDNYDEPGVTAKHSQTLQEWRSANSTLAKRVFRTQESVAIGFTLVDLTIEQYAKVMNDATVTTTPGPPATKSFNLLLGPTVTTFALVARGTSNALGAALPAQYQVPIVYQAEQPQPLYEKANPAKLACEYVALKDDALGAGSYIVQTA